jgi:hypothetical protein
MRDQSAFRPEPNQSFLPVSRRSVRGPFGRNRTPLTSMALIQPASDSRQQHGQANLAPSVGHVHIPDPSLTILPSRSAVLLFLRRHMGLKRLRIRRSSERRTECIMADDTTKRDYRDRYRINVHEDFELRYWTKELGVTSEKLKQNG